MTAGRSSIEALGPDARLSAAFGTRPENHYRGPAHGALRTPEPGPRDVALWLCCGPCPAPSLPAQAQLLDEGTVALDVIVHQVLQQPAAPAHQQEQATPAVMVVLVHLEVLGEIVDPPRQQCDLDLRRTGVTLTGRVPGDDLRLDCYVQRHMHSLSSSLVWQGPVTRNPARTGGDSGDS